MKCAGCGAENREGQKFCTSCGSRLALLCPQCGTAAGRPADAIAACERALDDADALVEARRLYSEVGATGHAARLHAEVGG